MQYASLVTFSKRNTRLTIDIPRLTHSDLQNLHTIQFGSFNFRI